MKSERMVPDKATTKDIKFYRGKGCTHCDKEGYKGRIGIYEVLEITPAIQDLMTERASTEKILQKALEEGMITMINDGFIKAATGITTLEEVLRVTRD